MDKTAEQIADDMRGVAGDYHEHANRLARKAWRAYMRGTGMRLSADEVVALHEMEADGDWWQSFSPAALGEQSNATGS